MKFEIRVRVGSRWYYTISTHSPVKERQKGLALQRRAP